MALQNVAQRRACRLDTELELFEHELGLPLDGRVDHLARLGIERRKARDIDHVAACGDGRGGRLPSLQLGGQGLDADHFPGHAPYPSSVSQTSFPAASCSRLPAPRSCPAPARALGEFGFGESRSDMLRAIPVERFQMQNRSRRAWRDSPAPPDAAASAGLASSSGLDMWRRSSAAPGGDNPPGSARRDRRRRDCRR